MKATKISAQVWIYFILGLIDFKTETLSAKSQSAGQSFTRINYD